MDALHLPEFDACLRYFDLESERPVRAYLHGFCLSAATLIPTATYASLRASRSILVDLFGFGYGPVHRRRATAR